MRIAHLTFTVDPQHQQPALDALVAAAPAVRAMPGCLAFIPFADPTSVGGIGLLHEWDSGGDFARYLDSPDFARINTGLRALMRGAPLSKRFEAEPLCDQGCQAA